MTNYTVFANNSQTGTQFTFAMAVLADTDGDGWGSADTLEACAQPEGYSAKSGDCDDTDAGASGCR